MDGQVSEAESKAGSEGEEFVNKGLRLWEARRKEWTGHGRMDGAATAITDGAKREGGVGEFKVASPHAADGRASKAEAKEGLAPPTLDKNGKRARSLDVDAIIASIFSTSGDARLPAPVPLSQMIDLLVDFWEADGLYD